MIFIWLVLLVFVWIVCGYIHYGWYFAYFQKEYPKIAKNDYEKDKRAAFITSFLGPIALLFDIACDFHKHGRKYK